MAVYQPMWLVLGSLCCGILLDACGESSYSVQLLGAFAGLVLWVFHWRAGRMRTAIAALLLSLACLAGAWHHACWRLFASDELGRFATETPQAIFVEGVAASAPVRRPAPPPDPMCTLAQGERTFLVLDAELLRDRGSWRRVKGRAAITLEGVLSAVAAGDRLRVLGELSAPRTPRNPGEADFAEMERRERRLCRISVTTPACVFRLPRAGRPTLRDWLGSVRQQGDARLWRFVGPARAGLASAILLGLRQELEAGQVDEFFRTGTTHLLAISGQHVAILVYGLGFLLRLGWMPRRASLIASVVFVVAYAMLTDARPPVVRAAVLVAVMCLARWLGRRSDSLHTLCLAAIVVLALNPTSLFDTGAQLSFLAVASLIVIGEWRLARESERAVDPIDKLIDESRPAWMRWIRRSAGNVGHLILLSSIVWLVTLPLVLYRFHLASFAGLLVNPMVALPMAVVLFSGFGVFALAEFSPPLAAICGITCDRCLMLMEAVLQGGMHAPAAYAWVPSVPGWWVAAFYAGLAVWVFLRGPLKFATVGLACIGVWIAFGFLLAYRVGTDSRREGFECTFVAVGHGTCVLIETPAGEKYLYDAGHQGTPSSAVVSISAVLWHRGVWKLDGILLSHPDADHYNAVPQLLDRFRVTKILIAPGFMEGGGASLDALDTAIRNAKVPCATVAAEEGEASTITGGLRVLHPGRHRTAGSDNSNSIVLAIVSGGRGLLLPGDLEPPGMERLISGPRVVCDVAMAPHHGSQRSTPDAFTAWAGPRWIVISGGNWRDTSASEKIFASHGAEVLHTAQDGAVRVVWERGDIRVQSWLDDRW
jgi:competence protein ComEC